MEGAARINANKWDRYQNKLPKQRQPSEAPAYACFMSQCTMLACVVCKIPVKKVEMGFKAKLL